MTNIAPEEQQKPQTPREWAREQGFAVKDTGRLPEAAFLAWRQANPASR